MHAVDIQDTVRRTFEVEPGGTLYLDADRGNATIRTGSANRVEVVVERKLGGRNDEQAKEIWTRHDLRITQSGSGVRIASTFDEGSSVWRRWRGGDEIGIEFIVTVPERYNVHFESGAGNLTIENLDGDVTGRTGAGNLELRTIGGSVTINSGSGNIILADLLGDARVSTGAGNVIINDVYGRMSVRTGAGNVVASFVRQPRGDVSLQSGAGNVTASVRDGVGLDVEGGTGMGSASAAFGLDVRGNFMSKSFSGVIAGGGPRLQLRSGVGNVRLTRE